jgi:hypothetical protein
LAKRHFGQNLFDKVSGGGMRRPVHAGQNPLPLQLNATSGVAISFNQGAYSESVLVALFPPMC